jgi:hypothetical protein
MREKPESVYSERKAIWARVEALKSEPVHSLLYIALCALQDHENRVLQMLFEAETSEKRNPIPQP